MRYTSLILSAIILIMLFGCNISIDEVLHSKKHDRKKLGKIYTRNKSVVSDGCHLWYPFVATDSTDEYEGYAPGNIITIKHDTPVIDYTDQVMAEVNRWLPLLADSIKIAIIDSIKAHPFVLKIPCPPDTVRAPDTSKYIRRIRGLDSSAMATLHKDIDSLKSKISEKDKKNIQLTTRANIFMWIAIALIGLSSFLAYLKFK